MPVETPAQSVTEATTTVAAPLAVRTDEPAPGEPTVPGQPVTDEQRAQLPSLSPSRAADFKTCPLLYRFRTIDRIPEPPTSDQARGTLVHAVLERLFDLPAQQRTIAAAAALVVPEWDRLRLESPLLAGLFGASGEDGSSEAGGAGASASGGIEPDGSEADGKEADGNEAQRRAAQQAFLDSTAELLNGYFAVEDPRRLEPAERECLVEAVVDDHLLIRGYIDRLDISPAGDIRVVDYKTGGAPREAFEARALFQLKFYALVLWRTRGIVPRSLRLLYLKDAEACDYSPDAEELTRFERNLVALWRAIDQSTRRQDFRPRPSRLCDWCSHHARCPAYGGTPPPFPEEVPAPAAEAESLVVVEE